MEAYQIYFLAEILDKSTLLRFSKEDYLLKIYYTIQNLNRNYASPPPHR